MSISLDFSRKLTPIQIFTIIAVALSAGVMAYFFPEGCIWVVFLGLGSFLKISFDKKRSFILDIIFPLFLSAFVLYFVEYIGIVGHGSALSKYWSLWTYMNRLMNKIGGISKRYLTEMLLYVAVYFCLRLFFFSRKAAAIATPSVFFLAAIINFYVYQFRGEELIAADFYGARTAISVASGYGFLKIQPIAFIIIPYVLFIIFVLRIKEEKSDMKWYVKLSLLLILSSSFSYAFYNRFQDYTSNHSVNTYGDLPTKGHGFPLNFIMSIFCINPDMPEGYSEANLENMLNEMGIDTSSSAYGDSVSNHTNIIVIMNESFSDFSFYENRIGALSEDPLDFWHSLRLTRNSVTGTAYSSVYGGKTPNSEFEYLTGITTDFLPEGSIPYSLYINSDIYSLPSYMRNMGYRTIAIHPMADSGWNREAVYPLLGFDEMYFKTSLDYTEDDMIHGYMSDRCLYRNIIDMIEDNNNERDLFLFMVTIQNHGGYTGVMDNLDVREYVGSDVQGSEAINNYLSLVAQSDDALEEFLSYLETRDERYLVIMYGDHQPNMEFSSALTAPGGSCWKVPYLIWANYELPDGFRYDSLRSYPTSINYLAVDTLTAAQISIPPYFEVIRELRQTLPCINSRAYYSLWNGDFYDSDSPANELEESALNVYRYYQYNLFFDQNEKIWDN